MARHEFGERVHHGDDRLTKVGVFDTSSAPQGTGTRHIAAFGGRG